LIVLLVKLFTKREQEIDLTSSIQRS
jgi:hypothetical protein